MTERNAAWRKVNEVLDANGHQDTPEYRQAWKEWEQAVDDERITKLIADLRAVGKTWREEIGDMPLFDRAADALEALTTENKMRRAFTDEDDAPWQGCSVPPDGWWCSREAGHEPPCAARPGKHPQHPNGSQ